MLRNPMVELGRWRRKSNIKYIFDTRSLIGGKPLLRPHPVGYDYRKRHYEDHPDFHSVDGMKSGAIQNAEWNSEALRIVFGLHCATPLIASSLHLCYSNRGFVAALLEFGGLVFLGFY
jgi:hypothetical protein